MTGVFKVSPPFIRNWARMAILSLLALSSVALAQAAFQSEGYKFLKAVRDADGDAVTQMLQSPTAEVLINSKDISTGETALHIAAARQDTRWIRFLTQKGANPNLVDKEGVTPLEISTRIGHVEGVTALLDAGARVDPVTSTGETPLIFAVHKRDVPMVKVLLEHGANPDRTDNSGRSARDYVAQIGQRRLSEEFAAAVEGQQATQEYGPSL